MSDAVGGISLGDLFGYAFSLLREGELALYRACGDGLESILLVERKGEPVPLPSLNRPRTRILTQG